MTYYYINLLKRKFYDLRGSLKYFFKSFYINVILKLLTFRAVDVLVVNYLIVKNYKNLIVLNIYYKVDRFIRYLRR